MASQRPDLLNLASNRLPIHLPWFPKVVSLGTTLHSSRFHSDNPFSDVSPFEQRSLRGPRFNLEVRHGAVGSFVSATTVKHSEKGEHMTLSLGISIDCLFAGASVTGQYEKETHNNNKNLKSSVRAKFHYGTVTFEQQPRLSSKGAIALKHPSISGDGLREFEEQFGDYYVAGYRLGGEAGMLLTESSSAVSSVEIKSIQAKVRFLCFSRTYRDQSRSTSSSSSFSADVIGYDTLAHAKFPPAGVKAAPSAEERESQAFKYGYRVQCLSQRVAATVDALDLAQDSLLTHEMCAALCRTGLVMELILLPVRYLREVMEWATDDNII